MTDPRTPARREQSGPTGGAVLWFRRDLRLGDHPAITAAAQHGPVTELFVLDDVLLRTAGAVPEPETRSAGQ